MGLFAGKARQRHVASLITGTVGLAKGGGWSVDWWGDGAIPPPVTAGTLTEAADQAAAATAALYAASQPVPGAELQLTIFPWRKARGDGSIFDITGGPGNYAARDIQGSDLSVTGASLEDLVAQAEQLPEGTRSMFRWIRQVSELPLAPS